MYNNINSTIQADDVIDIHVHIGGPAAENEKMYYWSKKFTNSLTFESMKLATRLSTTQLTGSRYLSLLHTQILQSKNIDKLVLLGLDEVYSEDNQVIKDSTHLYTSNQYLAHIAQIYDCFLYGCSVHPYAPDAIERLWHCARNGAVLCKWIPSSQGIDPTHPLAVAFYKALAKLGLPLLLHVGPEEAIPTNLNKEDELLFNAAAGYYGKNPGDGISLAIDAGVTVIVAHCATPIGPLLDMNNSYWEDVFNKLLDRVILDYADLPIYADLSALCLPGRLRYVKKIIPLVKDAPHKFLFGSDYPVPIISLSGGKGLEEILDALGWLASRALPSNDLDKNYRLLRSIFPEETFTASTKVLRNPQQPVPELKKYLASLGLIRKPIFWLKEKITPLVK